jgi:hypothetical protein
MPGMGSCMLNGIHSDSGCTIPQKPLNVGAKGTVEK